MAGTHKVQRFTVPYVVDDDQTGQRVGPPRPDSITTYLRGGTPGPIASATFTSPGTTWTPLVNPPSDGSTSVGLFFTQVPGSG